VSMPYLFNGEHGEQGFNLSFIVIYAIETETLLLLS
jgi:hypothetical protein